ncbi:DUF423 domain-containing protein [Oceanobacillus profundus]|uniref:DUF423 domain-containing protein n=1 Tax=Oceanobacillus profundus TaxID=372463 RepID=A0A417YNV2_9BACI|nr:DUF423 domain-containing protein [Oceanobacillus profundus]MBR3118202.1 DUF423 domain-containing protein [Oceanobacillus sp.]PAE30551.1 hypothetical protein CHI07_03195 [Paenibacillus sp. 7884-2]MCM3398803.1 DUF423 domain-containing protein [Oceanobacillus profundus]MDO6450120.1 DUF423 domain-containing protein [Oceanobacillus profundus]RHW35406.1 DUF423 domain-containing protein [Oceanobacillus profundus]
MKLFLLLGAINGFLAVALGAFGAHGLEGKLSEKAIATWEKAVDYQMFHTMALFVTGLLLAKFPNVSSLAAAGWLFLIGIILFSGSLYIYSLTSVKTFAMITPIGGVAFLIGWVLIGIAVMRNL